jgi:hypothetical protein
MQIKPEIQRMALVIAAVKPRTTLWIRLCSSALCLHLHLASVSSLAQSVVQFASDHGEVTEGDYGDLRLSIEPPAAEPLVVLIHPLFGGEYTASASDLFVYLGQNNSVEIPAGFRSWDVWAFGMDDGVPEGDETVGFTITSISGPATLGRATNMVFTIHNLKAQVSASFFAREGEGAYLDLRRSGDLDHEITVTYAITNGTARPNIDYIPTSGTVFIAANSTTARVDLAKVLLDNGTVDAERTVLVELRQDENGESAIIWRQEFPILDNEMPGSLVPGFKIVGRLLGVEPNGKLLIYGRLPAGFALGVYRTLPGGQVDPSFSISLKRPPPSQWTIDSSEHYVPAAAQEADGSWLVLWDEDETDALPAKLVRLELDGKLDPKFKPTVGEQSIYEFDPVPRFRRGDRLYYPHGAWPNWPLPNGQFLAHVLNKTNGKYALIRLNADGTLDSAFAPIESADGQRIQAVTATGKSLIEFYSSPFQGRFTASSFSLRLSDGSPDPSFHGSEIGELCDTLKIDRVLEQPDGRILISAHTSADRSPNYAPFVSKLVRFLAEGTRDTTFPSVDFDGLLNLTAFDSNQRLVAALYSIGGLDLIRFAIDGSFERFPFPVGAEKLALESDGTVLVEAVFDDSITPYVLRCDFSKTFEPRVDVQRTVNGPTPVEGEVWESAGAYEFNFVRFGDSSQVLSVRVETRDGTARAGEDYTSISQVVTFAPLELAKTIIVPILRDQNAERAEEFSVVLTDLNNPSRSPTPFQIRILDDQPSRMFTFGPMLEDPAFSAWLQSNFRLIFNAPVTEAWRVEASTDLKIWSQAGLSGNMTGSIVREWIDSPDLNPPKRFYRAVKE